MRGFRFAVDLRLWCPDGPAADTRARRVPRRRPPPRARAGFSRPDGFVRGRLRGRRDDVVPPVHDAALHREDVVDGERRPQAGMGVRAVGENHRARRQPVDVVLEHLGAGAAATGWAAGSGVGATTGSGVGGASSSRTRLASRATSALKVLTRRRRGWLAGPRVGLSEAKQREAHRQGPT